MERTPTRPTCSFASVRCARAGSPRGGRRRRRRRWRKEAAGWSEARGCRGESEMAETVADTRRLITKPQNLNDAYGPPSNFLEIDVSNPQTVGVGRGRFTTYEIRVKVRRPPLSRNPRFGAALPRQIPARGPEVSAAAQARRPCRAACLRAEGLAVSVEGLSEDQPASSGRRCWKMRAWVELCLALKQLIWA